AESGIILDAGHNTAESFDHTVLPIPDRNIILPGQKSRFFTLNEFLNVGLSKGDHMTSRIQSPQAKKMPTGWMRVLQARVQPADRKIGSSVSPGLFYCN